MNLSIHSESEMLSFGQTLARCLVPLIDAGATTYLSGDLGAGKTTLCRGVLRALGHEGAVKSPTFTLVEPYELDKLSLYHLDLYRLADPEELEYIGFDEYHGNKKLCFVEWPEKAQGFLPKPDLKIAIDVSGETRNIGITAYSERGEEVCKQLVQNLGSN